MVKPQDDTPHPPKKPSPVKVKAKPATTTKAKKTPSSKPTKPKPVQAKSNGVAAAKPKPAVVEPKRNLWEEAWMSVDVGDANRKRLTQKWQDRNVNRIGKLPKEYVEGVMNLTKSKLRIHQERWPSKTKGNAYDRASSILKSVMTVQALGDVVVKFDPTGYASIAWAVVSFGLTLIQNNQERMQRIWEASEYLAVLLARYSRIEALYHRVQVSNAAELGDAIVNSFKSLTQEPLKDLQNAIQGSDEMVEKWFRQIMAEQQQSMFETQEEEMKQVKKIQTILGDVNKSTSLIMKGIVKIDKTLSAEIQTQLLEWLFPSDLAAASDGKHRKLRSAIVSSDATEVAGRWLLERREYTSWLGSSLGGFPEEISSALVEDRKFARYPDTKTLIEYLHSILSVLELQKDVFIVLDGLDEVPKESQDRERHKLLELIKRLAQSGLSNLHILLVSKNEEDIRDCLRGHLKDILVETDVAEGLEIDIRNYIDTTMQHGDGISDLPVSLKSRIRTRLTEGAKKNFLWATSLVQEIRECRKDPKKIEAKLNEVPISMVAIYEKHLSSVNAIDGKFLRSMFIWLLRQLRPLTQEEIASAVGLHDADAVYEICTGRWVTQSTQTLTINRKSKKCDRVLRFAHLSAKEYLETQVRLGQHSLISQFLCSEEQAHFEITQRCLDVLLQSLKAGDTASANRFELTLRSYAAEYWFQHYQLFEKADGMANERALLQGRIRGLFRSEQFDNWLDWLEPGDQSMTGKDGAQAESRRQRRGSRIHYALKLNLGPVVEELIQTDPKDLNTRNADGETILQVAVYRGYKQIVADLLTHVNVNAEKGPHGTALYVASAQGHHSITEMLLNSKAKVTGTEDGTLGNPLHVAAYCGNSSIVSLLLAGGPKAGNYSGGVAVDHIAGFFGTALVAASAAGQESTVQMLLEHGASPNKVVGRLGTALQAAWNARPVSKSIIAALKAGGAKDKHQIQRAWTTAYRRMEKTDSSTVAAYRKLFLPQKSITKELSQRQKLLATALDKWRRLPCLWNLENCQANMASDYPFSVPFVEQLEDIKRYMSGIRMDKHELESEDFLYKALFWAGINHIIENIGTLISGCMRSLVEDSSSPQKSSVNESPQIPQAFLVGLPKHETKGLSPSDLNDLVAMDLDVQRGSYDDEKLPESKSGPQRAGLRPGYLATVDLLSHVKDLIHFGSKCTQYHELINDGREIPYHTRAKVEDLTFEVYSAVMRLATIKKWDHDSIVLQRTVKHLSTIRIPRISDIDSACWKDLTLAGMSRETRLGGDALAEVAKQLQGTVHANVQPSLSGQLDSIRAGLVSDVQVSLSALIKEELRNAVAQSLPTHVPESTRRPQSGRAAHVILAEPRS
ncbi:hypothetical protein RIB2604_02108290 [Aspergillus luchuensis]|uniref:Nephrocystin 3-like N-terminal domain-containing protein n=1 Tax=Aspergillus kawachii TaxID=1069201 RepID=A0A146FM60_ASPKA|nr:hypothetical protein RIB2604_02108290 [Aspergillus luchuensis]